MTFADDDRLRALVERTCLVPCVTVRGYWMRYSILRKLPRLAGCGSVVRVMASFTWLGACGLDSLHVHSCSRIHVPTSPKCPCQAARGQIADGFLLFQNVHNHISRVFVFTLFSFLRPLYGVVVGFTVPSRSYLLLSAQTKSRPDHRSRPTTVRQGNGGLSRQRM